jgi:hypothetical protein
LQFYVYTPEEATVRCDGRFSPAHDTFPFRAAREAPTSSTLGRSTAMNMKMLGVYFLNSRVLNG